MEASPNKAKINKLMTFERVKYAKVRCLGKQELELELELKSSKMTPAVPRGSK
jgi:hypothetical protein